MSADDCIEEKVLWRSSAIVKLLPSRFKLMLLIILKFWIHEILLWFYDLLILVSSQFKQEYWRVQLSNILDLNKHILIKIKSKYKIALNYFFTQWMHSHKKQIAWKHGPNWPHLCWEPSYARTHSSLPGKQTKEQLSEDCLWTHIFNFLKDYCQIFSFLCQDTNKTRSNCAIIGCNFSKERKLTLYKTQNRE